jgi:dihydroxyacetone kinase-like predicted kinase
VIGLVNGKLKATGDHPNKVVIDALQYMNAEDSEIITLYYGDSITADEAQQLADEISDRYPEQEIEVVDGGQPHYYYIVSAE